MKTKKSGRKKIIYISVAAILAVAAVIAFFVLTAKPEVPSTFPCQADTDCISVCGSCVNLTYFHENPPAQCAVQTNRSSGRSCYCVSGQCSSIANNTVPTSVATENQPENPDLSYVLISLIVIGSFVIVAVLVNHLMNSPTETWVL